MRAIPAPRIHKKPIALAVRAVTVAALMGGGLGGGGAVFAEAAAPAAGDEIEELLVTATRRSASVQDVPLNISALSGEALAQEGITGLADIAAAVPGLHVVDQGARGASRIVVRGLNAAPLASSEALNNSSGGTVATYLGEIPLYVDLRLDDIERVEVLLGPQGTLYGAGTLAGAIRILPRKPDFGGNSLSLRGDTFGYSESEDLGYRAGITGNLALADNLALRASIDRHDDPGFIDYGFVVRQPGVSDPDPDFGNAAAVRANLREVEDANDAELTSGRVAVRWAPLDALDATLTYYFQNAEAGARTINHRSSLGTDRYESGARVLEPNERDNELWALELTADLGFAELTSATGISNFDEEGQRDQTDLLISLEYGYETFPAFTALTRDSFEESTFNQELRLVSTGTGPLSWIVGGFYNGLHNTNESKEFVPGYDAFLLANAEDSGAVGPRPDALEYFSIDRKDLSEQAVYGEVTWEITPEWQVTVGGRWYKYELEAEGAVDFPLFNSVFDGAPPDAISLDFSPVDQDDDGALFKLNTAYRVSDEILAYFTVSEGYRIGGGNGVAPCPDPLPDNQIGCALPDERVFEADETTNYEVGVRSTWLEGDLVLNAAVYYIDWEKPQLAATTENGLLPITTNGKGAESSGVELSGSWQLTDALSVRGSYSYNKAELTDTADDLIATITPPGFQSTVSYVDGEEGDRLPGSPEHQGALFITWQQPVWNGWTLEANYGLSGISDVITRTGERGFGESLSGYVIHDASVMLAGESWTATLFVNNLTDKYAEASARDTRAFVQQVSDADGGAVNMRRYYKDVLPPRMFGLRFTVDLDGSL